MSTSARLRKPSATGAHLARKPSITVFGVNYLHFRLPDGSDFYATEYGRPIIKHLLPSNHWADPEWFAKNSVRLNGTSTIYKIATKEVDDVSVTIVLKWNRMGQDIPGETQASDLATAEFNSPFEEFSLATELEKSFPAEAQPFQVQIPLAIYVPRRHVEAERMGRRQHRITAVQERHREITLDANRQYAVIYQWIVGIDAAQACKEGIIDARTMHDLTIRSQREMAAWGFRVRDSKPHHVIVQPTPDRGLAQDTSGHIAYGLVDFELLERTPQHEQVVKASRRQVYLVRQAHRFEAKESFPPGLAPVKIMGVDYVYGEVESTAGALWVVGKDPVLFDYFLPERWRKTPRTKIPTSYEAFHTVTKDKIHLVWRVSRAGQAPTPDASDPRGTRILAHGYNSPFEEVAFSMELTEAGIETTYPRAIYMTGHKMDTRNLTVDESRYESHKELTTPEGHPILSDHHDYILIWGYWNGPDEQLAVKDEQVYQGINALDARQRGLIDEEVYARLLQSAANRLAAAGFEDLDLNGDHLLLSLDRSKRFVTDGNGIPAARICNFDLLRRIRPTPAPPHREGR